MALPSPIALQAQSRRSAGSIKTSACRRPHIHLSSKCFIIPSQHGMMTYAGHAAQVPELLQHWTGAKSEECFAMRTASISSTSLSQFLFLMGRLRLPCAAASSCARCKSTRLVLNLWRFRRYNMWLAGILLSAFALLPQPALSQELWSGAQSGMTLKQVLGVFPTAQPGNHAHLHGGASNDLSIAEYAIGEDNFTVDFFLLQDRHTPIVIRAKEGMARQND